MLRIYIRGYPHAGMTEVLEKYLFQGTLHLYLIKDHIYGEFYMLPAPNRLFVFDIEAVPDGDAVYNLTGFKSDNVQEQRAELERYHLEITDGKNPFPRQPFWKVVAISFLEAKIVRIGGEEVYEFVRLESNKSDDEGEIVAGFFKYFDKIMPRLVSYNGRGYDLPVLKYRAMKYGVQANALNDKSNKWENYTSRYSTEYHADLADMLSDYGASARCKMNEVCSILGLPGKFGVDGSQVSTMYDAGQLDEIRYYCETDVLNTYLLYLRNQHQAGLLSTDALNKANGDVLNFLDTQKESRPYLGDFKNAWEESSNGSFGKID